MTRREGYPDVRKVLTHMCKFGMVSITGKVGSALGPVLKPTGFVLRIAQASRASSPGNYHGIMSMYTSLVVGQPVLQSTPSGLCQAICQGLAAQLREDKAGRVRTATMSASSLKNCHG